MACNSVTKKFLVAISSGMTTVQNFTSHLDHSEALRMLFLDFCANIFMNLSCSILYLFQNPHNGTSFFDKIFFDFFVRD